MFMKKVVPVILARLGVIISTPVIAFGAGLLFVDDNGNVGIGNVTPQTRLDVSGTIYSRLATTTSSVNWAIGNVQSLALTNPNTALTFSNGQAGGQYTLIITQDGSGARTITWPSSVKWPGGIAPTLTTDANGSDD